LSNSGLQASGWLRSSEEGLALLGVGMAVVAGLAAIAFFGLGLDPLAADGFGIPCVFRAVTGMACPGCGMTRALLLASQWQWSEAWRMNPLLFPLLAACGFGALRTAGRRVSAS
jgi:hypothetical protein